MAVSIHDEPRAWSKSAYLRVRWWPDECRIAREAVFLCQITKLLDPLLIIWAIGEVQSAAVPKELFEWRWEPAAKVLWPRSAFLVHETLVRLIRLWHPISCPVESAGSEHVDEHERDSLQVVSS